MINPNQIQNKTKLNKSYFEFAVTVLIDSQQLLREWIELHVRVSQDPLLHSGGIPSLKYSTWSIIHKRTWCEN